MAINTVLTCALDRNTPRTCTPENAGMATTGDNQDIYIADLAINPITGQPDFSNSVPIDSYLADPARVKEAMQQLLDIIIGFFEVEERKVDNGTLKEEEMLLTPYVQEFDTNTKRVTRLPPKNPYQRRA